MSWSKGYKKSIDCENPQGFSQKAHCAGRKKRQSGGETKSKSPFIESKEVTTYTKFTHKTKHLAKSQHQLDPNLDLKHLVHHSVHQYVDRDADGDIDVFDNPKKKIPDENVSSTEKAQEYSNKLIKKQRGEIKHTRKGMAYEEFINEEGLLAWFGQSKSKGKNGKKGKRGWVDVVDGDACAREEGETATPKCVPSWERASMSKAERLAAQARKRRQDPNQPQKSGAAKPTYVKTDYTPEGGMDLQEIKDKPGKGSGKKDACYHKVKSRYSVWPSAYASGALVKCRKVGADSWGTKSESVNALAYDWDAPIYQNEKRYCPKCQKMELRTECKYGSKYWSMFSIPYEPSNQMKYDIAQVHPANEEKDHEYSMARSELSTIISAARRLKKKMKGEGNIEAWVQSKITKAADYIDTAADYLESGEHKIDEDLTIQDALGNNSFEFIDIVKPEPLKPSKGIGSQLIGESGKKCWKGYEKTGTQKLFGKRYNRCVKKEELSNWREELFEQGTYIMPKASQSGAYSGGPKGAYKVGDTIPASATKPKPSVHQRIKAAGDKYGKEAFQEDWQSANRKDRTDGMSRETVKKYRQENPDSKLQTAVTEKKPKGKRAKRRANFCRRMKGMKSKLTSAKTARDPDSRINKALRRWRCR
jgi:hypothetical protein